MQPQIVFPLIIFVVFPLIWFIATYNKFIKLKNMIEENWSGIDVALKRRHNLIPNLIKATQGYSRHESEVLEKTVKIRTADESVTSRQKDESQVSRSLIGLMATAEAYPDLKASDNFLILQNSLDEIEQEIQKTRNMYNYAIRRFNTLVESFPSSLVAKTFGFEKRNFFSLELATQRELPEVDFSEK
ncbi:MAG: LemA family protein [Desulfobulbaceae bacterium]|nr:LemA family protein [Desulfobulbaceae bacterium]